MRQAFTVAKASLLGGSSLGPQVRSKLQRATKRRRSYCCSEVVSQVMVTPFGPANSQCAVEVRASAEYVA